MEEEVDRQVRVWFAKGEEDLYTAKRLVTDEYFPVGIVCFHCQQCAEKYLKGLLVHLGANFSKSHDLIYLLEVSKDRQLIQTLHDDADLLTGYAIEPRYAGEDSDLPITAAHDAIRCAEAVKAAVLEKRGSRT